MNTNEMWDSVARSTGDSAGVFEFDGDAGHFYLYKTTGQVYIKAMSEAAGHPLTDSIAREQVTHYMERIKAWGLENDRKR